MKTTRTSHEDPLVVVTLLVFLQGAVVVALAAEAIGTTFLFGGAQILSAGLTVLATVATVILGSRLKTRRRSTRKWIMWFQVAWLTFAALDIALALFLAGRVLTPVGMLVRVVLPGSILWLLRHPAIRREFLSKFERVEISEDWILEEMLV